MAITDQAAADSYLADLVAHALSVNEAMTRDEALALVRENLGYYAGYYAEETRARVERLYKCVHPIFGSIAQHGAPGPEEAFAAGRRIAGALARSAEAAKRESDSHSH